MRAAGQFIREVRRATFRQSFLASGEGRCEPSPNAWPTEVNVAVVAVQIRPDRDSRPTGRITGGAF
jgi:hypothetical protein